MSIAALALIIVATPPATDMTPMLGFANARMCKLVPEGERIAVAIGAARRNIRVATLTGGRTLVARVTDRSGRGDTDRMSEVTLPTGSTLHGLPVMRILTKSYHKAESDAYRSREIVFAVTPARVHAMMRSLGADVPPSPGYLAIPDPDDIQNGAISIKGSGSTTTLRCSWGL